MKNLTITALAIFVLALGLGMAHSPAEAGVKSLRGDVAMTEQQAPASISKPLTPPKFERSYKQQPPLVTHKTEKYQIDLKRNGCLKCHDKANYKDEDAPMAGKSHYTDASGKEGDKIYMGRYFCLQCHVPQVDAKPLVENSFQGAK
ncbi:MAG: nitrate reductase cytochrome c-type subunit [Rhodospirillales bacterium]|nr:nitrate reductase cytochrome c-type subunit [Rhodospirillales bacterium]MCW9001850.1 nitrate reductase cytochrome c-type subunit [Rhodospirillales bacterium]MCW9040792.1 nitrate reductase cytochrome c-type subunit [Rhodospirillales bacterium]